MPHSGRGSRRIRYGISASGAVESDGIRSGGASARNQTAAAQLYRNGGSRDKIAALARRLRPHFVQLHYRETISDTLYLCKALRRQGTGVFKTLPHAPQERLLQFGTDDVGQCVKYLNKCGVSAILCDSRAPSNAAEKSNLPDLAFYRKVKQISAVPVILAGGIGPENVRMICSCARPEAIDLMTGVEARAGVKDRILLERLMRQLEAL